MTQHLYSIILELQATRNAIIPTRVGHQTHGLFLNLIRQADASVSERIHDKDKPAYRPFTVSALKGAHTQDDMLWLRAGEQCHFRVTLLDQGELWHCLNSQVLKVRRDPLRLGSAEFQLHRVISTPQSEEREWVGYTDWQTLANTKAQRTITLCFESPTAFHLGDRRFHLFPDPLLVWDSLLRSWNLYAPECLHIEKQPLREFLKGQVVVNDHALQAAVWYFPQHPQKGYVGSCTYLMKSDERYASQIAALAEFASYAGIGYKTTMGMGQTRKQQG